MQNPARSAPSGAWAQVARGSIFGSIMAYAWQRVPAQGAFEAARKQPISFDSWVLVLFEDPDRPSSEQPKTTAWFSDPEEAMSFLEERLVPLWYSGAEAEARTAVLAQVGKLKSARKLKLKELEAWRKAFNGLTRSKGQILWLGTFDDLHRGEASADELGQDLEFWLEENGVDPHELSLDESRQHKLVVDFLIQIGA